jgi:hypothetical protein
MKTLQNNIKPTIRQKLVMLGVDISSANFWLAVNYHNLFGNWNCVMQRMERLGLSDARNLFQIAYDVNKMKKGL